MTASEKLLAHFESRLNEMNSEGKSISLESLVDSYIEVDNSLKNDKWEMSTLESAWVMADWQTNH